MSQVMARSAEMKRLRTSVYPVGKHHWRALSKSNCRIEEVHEAAYGADMCSWRCRTRGHIVPEVELIEVPTLWTPVWVWQGRLEGGWWCIIGQDVCVEGAVCGGIGQNPNKKLKARELSQTLSLAHGARKQSPIAQCWQCQVHILRISVSIFCI